MTIEVKQLQITSTVSSKIGPSDGQAGDRFDVEAVRDEILAECRRMIKDALRAERER